MTKKKPKAETPNKAAVEVKQPKDEPSDAALAQTVLSPSVQAASTIQLWQCELLDFKSLLDELKQQVEMVNSGDMKRPETMLLTQAHTLDSLFNKLAQKAYKQEYISQLETFLRLALKAQSQCRSTLETLATLKNPVIFAQQANIAHGSQQINNGIPSRAEEQAIAPNKLLRESPHATLDTGRTIETGAIDSPMETVAAVHRPENICKQGQSITQPL
ncbi:MAG: hypothetical protein PHY16_07145 [Methylobacter sp.]|nr:hypothetical protein [Methylobacter sp.]